MLIWLAKSRALQILAEVSEAMVSMHIVNDFVGITSGMGSGVVPVKSGAVPYALLCPITLGEHSTS